MNTAGPTNQRTGGFGGTVTLVTGNIQQVPVINNPSGMRLAQTFTLLLSVTVPPTNPDGSAASCNCVAAINWVENGQQVQRLVTVGPGTGVSVSGSGTGVQVSFSDVPIGAHYVGGLTYQATALLAPGVRAAQSQLPVLQQILPSNAATGNGGATFALAPGAFTGTIPIPQNAGVRSVWVSAVETNAVGSPIASTVYCTAINPGGDLLNVWNPNVSIGMVPLPPGATGILIQNNDNINPVQITILWGVDG
jgi:hypothetical protein